MLKKIKLHGNITTNKFKPRFAGTYKINRVQDNEVS